MRFGVIGVGNMGYPMLCGAVKTFGAENVSFTCIGDAERKRAESTGASAVADNMTLAKNSDILLLAIKPYVYATVLEELKTAVKPGTIVISVAAGITVDFVKTALEQKVRVIRIMPNTPAMVGEGMTAVTYDPNSTFTDEEKQLFDGFFNSFGSYVVLPENLQDAAIPASGSSSAFVYVMIEAMADAAVACGIPRDTAYKMTAQTVLGAAKMVLETGEHPGKLKDNVCTPGGTTIAGIRAMEQSGFRSAVMEACIATYDKVKSMQK